ncbi:MAG: TetR/AcrR family transcriptional regulator [Clostridiales bacterium]|jgi:AcrR family transcriptional regulator|nr:TetR/AcrR family transcriptional regulator [Clostridiales bacterium]
MVDFDKLPAEKQRVIINAALLCFGKNGYKKASVADIAEAAGIAKASVFQYFGTKKGLYFYLFNFSCEKITQQMRAGGDDYFECIKIGTAAKMRVMAQYSGMPDFLSSMVKENDGEILAELHARFDARLNDSLKSLFVNVDWNKFKPEIGLERSRNIIKWVSDGYVKSAVENKDTDTMLREIAEYMDLLKSLLYKEEYLK